MLSIQAGYAYAESIDMVFNRAARNHSISDPENYKGYAALIRTVRTTLAVMESENNKHLPRCPACGKAK